jgi:hypothetical protein
MTTPVNKIIQTLESILEQCNDKKDLATHNQIKDSSIYYEGMVDVLSYTISSFKGFSIQDENEWKTEIYEAGFIDGVDGKRVIR